jgi:hypothetical protein
VAGAQAGADGEGHGEWQVRLGRRAWYGVTEPLQSCGCDAHLRCLRLYMQLPFWCAELALPDRAPSVRPAEMGCCRCHSVAGWYG